MSKRKKEIGFNLLAWLIAGNMFVIFRFFGMYGPDQFIILKNPIELEQKFFEANIVSILNGLLLKALLTLR